MRFSVLLKRIVKTARKSSIFRKFVTLILVIFPFLAVGAGISLWWIVRELPDIHSLKDYRPSITTRIYDENNRLIDEFFLEDRRVIAIAKVPKYVINAFVAAEDSRFFQHKGIDPYGIARAFFKNIEHGSIVQGGSTITQQVAKSFYLSSERTYLRKFRELVLAHRINKYLKKYEILNLYLNQIYLGHGTYGIEAASQAYFGKSARDLSLAEAAMLAGLPKAPSRYSPFVSAEKALQRQSYVLTRMVEDGLISEREKEKALKTKLVLNVSGPKGKAAPYFTENVRRYILANYGSDVLYKEGLEVYTTLNVDTQRAAAVAVERGLRELESRAGFKSGFKRVQGDKVGPFLAGIDRELQKKPLEKNTVVRGLVERVNDEEKKIVLRIGTRYRGVASLDDLPKLDDDIKVPVPNFRAGDVIEVRITNKPDEDEDLKLALILPRIVQGALLCMDARTGEIKAMVGGRDFKHSEFNRATQARRQPGSAFKPVIYAAALDRGMTPTTLIADEPISFVDPARGEWQPQNYDMEFHGVTTLRTSLVHSRNIPTIKILKDIGVDYVADYASNLGITSPLSRNLSLALGTSAVTLQELVRAFGVLANQGKRVEPFYIKKIIDRTGNVFEEHGPKVEQVIDPKIAYITTSILMDAVQRGTGTRVKTIGRPVAGKTGTTDEFKDAWFLGYTPSLVAGVWVGFDDGKPLGRSEAGGVAAAPIWLYFMEKAVSGTPVENFPVPDGIVFAWVEAGSGRPAKPWSKDVISECFLEGTIPPDIVFPERYDPEVRRSTEP